MTTGGCDNDLGEVWQDLTSLSPAVGKANKETKEQDSTGMSRSAP